MCTLKREGESLQFVSSQQRCTRGPPKTQRSTATAFLSFSHHSQFYTLWCQWPLQSAFINNPVELMLHRIVRQLLFYSIIYYYYNLVLKVQCKIGLFLWWKFWAKTNVICLCMTSYLEHCSASVLGPWSPDSFSFFRVSQLLRGCLTVLRTMMVLVWYESEQSVCCATSRCIIINNIPLVMLVSNLFNY